MSTFGITRPELIRLMVEVGTLLTGPKPLSKRLTGLCQRSAEALGCAQVAIMEVDGDCYRGVFHHGLPAELADNFDTYEVSRSKELIVQLEKTDSYLLFNGANEDPLLQRSARAAGVTSAIIAPFTHPDGTPFGYLTAGFTEVKRTVSPEEAELAMGFARLAQAAMLRDLEKRRRQEVSKAMLEVADNERRRLSRDIHDDPLQRILGLRLGLEGFREHLTDEADIRAIDGFVDQCRRASATLRGVMLNTHPNASELADLEEVLTIMVQRHERGSQLRLEFQDLRSGDAPDHLVSALNRIGEQAARNTLHHANATVLRVRLTDRAGGTLLTVTDDGQGFDLSGVSGSRLGLISMRERAELLDGTFEVDSVKGSGTVVTTWLPHQSAEKLRYAS